MVYWGNMMNQRIVWGFLMAVIVFAPFMAFADHGGLVPCGIRAENPANLTAENAPCTLCHIFVLAQNIINFLMLFATPVLAVLGLTWGGFKILVSGPNPGLRSDGIRIMKTVIVGLLIVFGAWIIINELLHFFTNRGHFEARPWTTIQCQPNSI